jgi:hypothetical protein
MTTTTPRPKFRLGRLLATPGALRAIADASQEPMFFLARHISGDWGSVCTDDKDANDQALIDGSRILSAYQTLQGQKIWIITEATDDNGDRAATTILLPEEY